MQSRGLTLLELLIALALILALGAIAMPTALKALADREFNSARDTTVQQLLMARAHAQTTGQPVEVIYHGETRRIEARALDLDGSSSQGGESAARFDDELAGTQSAGRNRARRSATQPVGADDEAGFGVSGQWSQYATEITESWATRRLAGSVRMSDKNPQSQSASPTGVPESPWTSEGSADFAPADESMPGIESQSESSMIRLAIYLPDGSTMINARTWFADGERFASLSINPWTGVPSVSDTRFQRDTQLQPESEFDFEQNQQQRDDSFETDVPDAETETSDRDDSFGGSKGDSTTEASSDDSTSATDEDSEDNESSNANAAASNGSSFSNESGGSASSDENSDSSQSSDSDDDDEEDDEQ